MAPILWEITISRGRSTWELDRSDVKGLSKEEVQTIKEDKR